jgi:small GTP-binding protein
MSRLTGQHSEAAAYEFTTLTSVPGQVVYNGAPLQMIDLPGIIEGAKDGRGRGRQVIAVAKTCHLIFIVLDVNKPLTDKRVIESELEGFGIRINKEPPNITFKKKDKGGLNITSTVPLTHIDNDEIRAVMSEWVFSVVLSLSGGVGELTAWRQIQDQLGRHRHPVRRHHRRPDRCPRGQEPQLHPGHLCAQQDR